MTRKSMDEWLKGLRKEKQREDLLKELGLSSALVKKIGIYMLLNYSDKQIGQKEGLHLTTIKRYKKVLGQQIESKFNLIIQK